MAPCTASLNFLHSGSELSCNPVLSCFFCFIHSSPTFASTDFSPAEYFLNVSAPQGYGLSPSAQEHFHLIS